MISYNFVPRIEDLAEKELERLRQSPKGSHVDIILQEALRDRDYSTTIPPLPKNKRPWMITSFIDLNPELADYCDGVILRSEFLFLRYLGDREFNETDIGDYLDFLQRKIFPFLPENVIYRLCDHNDEDFSFFSGKYGTRGAKRLLQQDLLLSTDLAAIDELRKRGKRAEVLVPYAVFPEEFQELRQRITSRLGDIKVGVMLEVPANLLEAERFSDSDFYVFGPGDLIKNLYGGIDRDSPDFEKVDAGVVIPLVRKCMEGLDSPEHRKKVYLVKNLVGIGNDYPNLEAIDAYMPSQLMAAEK
ncbi:hypothetical protein HYX09_03180 [Candidatus Woesearchaeota archaeon]|nr:hypothetical protein [Candidatus Woesearchaeota archaeon]